MKRLVTLTGIVALLCVTPLAPHARAEDSSSRSLVLLGQSGRVERNQDLDLAIVVGGSLVVEGVVRGPAAAIGGDVELLPGAVVEEGVYAIGGVLRIDEHAQVQGARTQVASGDFGQVVSQLSDNKPAEQAAPGAWLGPVLRLAEVIGVLIIGLMLAMLAPRQVHVVRATLAQQPAKSALAGFALLLGFLPLCAILAVSLLGIPLIPLAVFALLGTFIMGISALAAELGYRIPWLKGKSQEPGDLAGALALGMLLIAVCTLVPVLGGLLWFLASFYAAGAVIISRFGTHAPPPPNERAQLNEPTRRDLGTPGSVTP